jgi:hypothetical protein
MAGWFKVQRDIQDHWIWKSKEPFDKRSAWVDLIMLANFKEFKTMYKGKIVCRKRGEVNTSVVYLAKRWRWDRRKVNRFLMALAADNMLSLNSTSDGTTITIENYAKYQDVGTTNSTGDGTAHGTPDGTGDGTAHGTHDKKTKRSHKEVIDENEWKEGHFTLNDDDDIPGLEGY